jgi:hypothetical protein
MPVAPRTMPELGLSAVNRLSVERLPSDPLP